LSSAKILSVSSRHSLAAGAQARLERRPAIRRRLHAGIEKTGDVAALRLCAVHRQIGLPEQRVDVGCRSFEQRDADAGRADGQAAGQVIRLAEERKDLVDHVVGLGDGILQRRAQVFELAAAEARQLVAVAQAIFRRCATWRSPSRSG
jgi:hypothetical protein